MSSKYWLYNDGSIYGPFGAEELSKNSMFGAESLLCPENIGGDRQEDWKTPEEIPEVADALKLRQLRPPSEDLPADIAESKLSQEEIEAVESFKELGFSDEEISKAQEFDKTDESAEEAPPDDISLDYLKKSPEKKEVKYGPLPEGGEVEPPWVKKLEESESFEQAVNGMSPPPEQESEEFAETAEEEPAEEVSKEPEPVKEEAAEKVPPSEPPAEEPPIEDIVELRKPSVEFTPEPAPIEQKEGPAEVEPEEEPPSVKEVKEEKTALPEIKPEEKAPPKEVKPVEIKPVAETKKPAPVIEPKKEIKKPVFAPPPAKEKSSQETKKEKPVVELKPVAVEKPVELKPLILPVDLGKPAPQKKPEPVKPKETEKPALKTPSVLYMPDLGSADKKKADTSAGIDMFKPLPRSEKLKPVEKETEPASVKKDFVAEKPPADTASKKPEPLPASSDRKAAEKPDEKNVQATAFAPGEATARTPQKLRIPTLRNASAGHDFSMPMDVLSGQKADEVEEARQRAEDAKAQKTLLIAAFAGFLAVSAGAFYFFVKDQFISPSKDNKISSETAKPSAADKEKPLPQKDQPPEPKPYEGAAQQNADKSIEIAKNFDLGGGRGTVLQWFRNSFIAAAGSASQEEWKSTFLSGDLYIVQYKLLRPRAQPIIYQFEVNVAEGKTTRGINNPAIELLGGTPVVAQEVSAPKPKKKRRQLPLPVAPKNSGKKGLTGEDFSNIENLVGTSGD